MHFPFGSRSIRAGQLAWAMRGMYARRLAAPPFTIVSHAPATSESRGAFERMVHRVSGASNAHQLPGELVEVTEPRSSGRVATFTLPLDTRIHLGAQRGRAQRTTSNTMALFIWDLANVDVDENTRFRYAADIAGTPAGTKALLEVLPRLAGSTQDEREAVDDAYFRCEEYEEDDGSIIPADPDLAGLEDTCGVVELALRMAWLRHGRQGPMPTAPDHAPDPPGRATRSTSPSPRTWEEANTALADHLNAICVGPPGPIRNIIAQGPGNRFVQFSCTQGEGMLAEVVGDEYIDADPDFYTPARLAAMAALGYVSGMFGDNHGRTYDHTQWRDAANHATTILREVLDLSPEDITLIQS